MRAETSAPVTAVNGTTITSVLLREASNSYQLAVEHVYLFGKLRYAVDETDDAPVVPDGYTKTLKALSLSQMIRASALARQLLRPAPL